MIDITVPLEMDENSARSVREMFLSKSSSIAARIEAMSTLSKTGWLTFSPATITTGIQPRSPLRGPQHLIVNGTVKSPYIINVTVPESEGIGLMRGHQLPLAPDFTPRHYTFQLEITRPVQIEVIPRRHPHLVTSLY